MSSLGSWLWGTSQLDDAVDKATSELLPTGSEDIALNLEICDQIRSKSVPAKDAMQTLKRRLNHKNPNVQNLALGLTDICIKNGGDTFLVEIASREFMDNLVSILKIPGLNNDVKQNILRLIQNWSIAFEGKYTLAYVGQVYKTLVKEGYTFPPKDMSIANSAMVDTQTAPEWVDSDVCLRCRTPFTFTNRKHHCRNCGLVFDQQCSSKSMALPHFGITQEVRVCDGCYNKQTRKADKTDKGRRYSQSPSNTRHRTARELADEELQRAIELSLQEVGATGRAGYVPAQPPNWQASEPPIVDRTSRPSTSEEDDPDLRAAIEASLREANAPKPSAPTVADTPRTEYVGSGYSQFNPLHVPPAPALPVVPNYELDALESDAILTFTQKVEQVEAQGGRDISRYPAVNELYDKALSLRPKLALSLDDASRKEEMLSDMHEKLSQVVKLYDRLLTEQVAHPRWRLPSAATTSYQPVEHTHTILNGVSQHGSTSPATSATYQQAEPPKSPQTAYWEYQWPQQHVSSLSNAASTQQQWQQQQALPAISFASTTSLHTEPHQQLSDPPYQSFASPPPSQAQPLPPVTLPPVTFTSQPFQSSPPVERQLQYAMSPPPPPPHQEHQQPQAVNPLPPTPATLDRHKSVSYMQPRPTPSTTNSLARGHTVAIHRQSRQQYQQQPELTPLPQFPVAPTLAPQSFPMFGPSVPTSLVQPEERKEALLIDL